MTRNNYFKKIGITGGIGSGKSQVLDYVREHTDCITLKADDIGNDVKKKGHTCYERIVSLLGEDILGEDGEIIKPKMADKIFASEELLSKVNGIIHPAVQDEIDLAFRQAEKDGKEFAFIEAALLIEAGYPEFLDEVWVVHCDPEERRRRLTEERGYSKERTDQIMAKQLSEEEFLLHANRVIDNNGTIEETFRQIDIILEALKHIKESI